jgi:hypothetical protein
MEFAVDNFRGPVLYFPLFRFGGIAQLGERLTGSQEVSGSIPLISTRKNAATFVAAFFLHKTQKMIQKNDNSIL